MTFHEEEAVRLFREGCNCSQAVFTAFSDVTGIEKNTALRMSSSFGGGMGRLREVCGALSGAFLAAGCLFGYDNYYITFFVNVNAQKILWIFYCL